MPLHTLNTPKNVRSLNHGHFLPACDYELLLSDLLIVLQRPETQDQIIHSSVGNILAFNISRS